MLPSALRCQNNIPAQTPLGFIRSETDYDLIVFVVFEAIFPANVLLAYECLFGQQKVSIGSDNIFRGKKMNEVLGDERLFDHLLLLSVSLRSKLPAHILDAMLRWRLGQVASHHTQC
ncbi:hypothetical protein DPX16_7450 [Anabarilius grahami]|uniref:Uncharacterized protein n=1 Tax=Anabarilius grahami TaxID=495550 RepID=A0A3N0YL68_ANAGA|nr:hypothetical protein DPX16_7450 [Anabarilius grahami]